MPSTSLLAAPDSVTGDPEISVRSEPALAVGAVLLTTETVAVCCAGPPAPVQDSVKLVVALRAPVAWEPLVALDPLHPALAGAALAVQELAFTVLQFKVELPPAAIVAGIALSVIMGNGKVTATEALALAVPPAPVQASVKVVLAASAAETSLPLVALVPVQPPLAVQLVAFVDDQARLVDEPLVTEAGVAVSVTVGATGAVTVTEALAWPLPPAPLQLRLKVALAVSAAEFSLPLVALLPVQPPDAVHEVALLLLQVSAAAEPEMTLVGLALSVTVGAAAGGAAEPPPPPQAAIATDTKTGAVKRTIPDRRMRPIFDPIAPLINAVFLKAQVRPAFVQPAGCCRGFVYKIGAIGHNSCPRITTHEP